MELPLVSILITSYNRASYIEAAIESALKQTYPHIEIIVTDNCSTDGTQALLAKYTMHEKVHVYINETNIGQFPNRNKAASLAQGKYLKYLDSDDLLYPHTVAVMVNAMERCSTAALGISYEINSKDHLPFPFLISASESIRLHFDNGLLFPGPGSVIYKKEVFDEFGGFEDIGLPSDNFLTLKIASRYSIAALPRDLYWWRRHADQAFNSMAENPDVQLQYYRLNEQILLSTTCPVSPHLSSYFLLCNRTRLCRWCVRYIIRGKFSVVSKLIKDTPLGPLDFFRSLFPVHYFKPVVI